MKPKSYILSAIFAYQVMCSSIHVEIPKQHYYTCVKSIEPDLGTDTNTAFNIFIMLEINKLDSFFSLVNFHLFIHAGDLGSERINLLSSISKDHEIKYPALIKYLDKENYLDSYLKNYKVSYQYTYGYDLKLKNTKRIPIDFVNEPSSLFGSNFVTYLHTPVMLDGKLESLVVRLTFEKYENTLKSITWVDNDNFDNVKDRVKSEEKELMAKKYEKCILIKTKKEYKQLKKKLVERVMQDVRDIEEEHKKETYNKDKLNLFYGHSKQDVVNQIDANKLKDIPFYIQYQKLEKGKFLLTMEEKKDAYNGLRKLERRNKMFIGGLLVIAFVVGLATIIFRSLGMGINTNSHGASGNNQTNNVVLI